MWINKKPWRMIAGLNGFIAIIMGTIAAHIIKDAHMAEIADKASIYQLIHAVVLLWLSDKDENRFCIVRWLFLIAIIMFCGSLYIKAITGLMGVTIVAPFGGICFMTAWIMIAFKSKNE